MGIDEAIAQLDAEIDQFQHGSQQGPAEHSTEWFLLRAKVIGRSTLKRMKQLGVHEMPAAAERYYRNSSKHVKVENDKD